jgi:hypothetical protein
MVVADPTPKEGIKQLIELAVSCGRKFQNEQTGFVHYYHTKEDEKNHGAIPVYENLLFALALMCSKHTDTVQEGKGILEKILFFQNFKLDVGMGGFPIYLHEYPHCKEKHSGIRLLPVFFGIFNQFHHVLGNTLKAKLIDSSRALLSQCFQVHEEKPASPALALTLGLAAQKLTSFIDDAGFEVAGKKIIEETSFSEASPLWYSPSSLSDLLIAMQMAGENSLPQGWTHFWQFLSDTWHRESCAYAGPGWKEFYLKEEPQATLYDLYMGFASGCYSYRAFVTHPFQLQGALITHQPVSLPPQRSPSKGSIGLHRWLCENTTEYGLCLLAKKEEVSPYQEKGFIPLKLLWGDRTRVHSFICQGGNIDDIEYAWSPGGNLQMEATLGVIPNGEDKEKAREVVFFTEALEGVHFDVDSIQATTFKLGEQICFFSAGKKIKLTFDLAEGDGNFVGHIMRGNRPSQIGLKGEHRLEAFDWQIYLRTIYRTSPCKIRVLIEFA